VRPLSQKMQSVSLCRVGHNRTSLKVNVCESATSTTDRSPRQCFFLIVQGQGRSVMPPTSESGLARIMMDFLWAELLNRSSGAVHRKDAQFNL